MASERIEPATAHAMSQAGDTVIDVRLPEEYASGHVAGAINIPLDRLTTTELPPGQLLTACGGGGRATRAADLLDTMGRAAFVIDGGTRAWEAAGYPITRGAQP